jgi:hypothetical protein
MKVFHLVLAIVFACPLAVHAANLGLIDGTVRDEAGPVANAHVALLRAGRRLDEHVTAADGHFEFEQVPFGSYRIEASTDAGRITGQEVRVASGEVAEVELAFRSAEEELVVTARRPQAPPPSRSAASTSTLERQDLKNLPRGDTASVNEILATQPGFVYDAMGNLFARGNHANIQYQLDGVPLPDSVSGLFGGFLSPKLVENMEIITGGMDAEYGERLAAVVNLNSRKPSEGGEGSAEFVAGSYKTLNPSLLYGRRFGSVSVLAGASFKTTDRALDPAVFDDLSHDAGDEERAFLKVDYDQGEHIHWSALGSYAHNFYRLPFDTSVPPFNPALPGGGRVPDRYGNAPAPFFPAGTNQTENEKDAFALLSFRDDFNPRSSLRLAATYRHSDAFLFGDAPRALGPGADPCTGSGCSSDSDVARTADHLGFNAEQLFRAGEHQLVKLGGQVDQLFGVTDYTSYTRSDTLQAPDPALTIAGTDNSHATTGGVYLQDRIALGALTVNAGARADFQHVSFVDRSATQVGIGPRLGLSYALSANTVVHAFGGLLWQPPPVLDAPAAARILGLVPPGQSVTYDLLPERDRYAELGIESRVLPVLTLKLTAWGKLSKDQLDDVGVGTTNLVSPYNFREGRAGGVEAGAVLALSSHFNGFANASLEQAQGRGIETARYLFSPDDLANNDWQLLDHVQIWTANAGATARLGQTRLSGLLQYGSGLRTGANNDQHVPDHLRFDTTLSHQFLEIALRPSIALDVVNLFDARYAYRLANGFNGSHWAPGRSLYLRLAVEL